MEAAADPAGPAVCVIDVGAPRNLGWAVVAPGVARPETFDGLLALLPDLVRSRRLCLGFEAPLFLPRVDDWRDFTKARRGDGSRPWSAGAGAAVAVIGLALLVHVLERLREASPEAEATLDPGLPARPGRILIFEAFVAGAAKRTAPDASGAVRPTTRHEDAAAAAQAYARMRGQAGTVSAVTAERPFSLAGAALLAAGWGSDLGLPAAPCLVVRPGAMVL